MKKRIISLMLTLCMVFTLMPTAVSAAEVESETTTIISATEIAVTAATTEAVSEATTATTATVAAVVVTTSATDAPSATGTEAAGTTTATSSTTTTTTTAPTAAPKAVTPTDVTTETDIPASSTVSGVFNAGKSESTTPKITTPKITSATDIDAVEKAQLLINSLPDGENITESNLETVENHLDAIDEALSKLTAGERATLNFDKYNAAIAAVNALYGMEGADIPATADDTSVLQSMLNSDGTIKLQKDTVVSATLTVTKNITFDLNGYVLQMTGTGSVFDVSEGGSLTITDSTPTKTHSGSYASLPVGGVITGGTGTLVSAHTYGGGVYLRRGTLTMKGGTIYKCTADYGGGVYINQYREFEMTGGTIKGCTATMGDAVFVSGTFKANGGEIRSVVHISETGTIECTSSSACTVFNETVTAWKGAINGGVFFGSIVANGGTTVGTKYIITFNLNGGSGKTKETIVGTNVKAVKPVDPTKTDCVFMGWYKDGVEYNFNEVLTSDITLDARWLGSEVSDEAELRAAINGGLTSIKLTSDITLSKTLEYSDKKITLDLNGHVITGKIKLVDNPASPGTTLTLIDSDPTATHSDSTLPKGGVVNGNIELTRNTGGTECSLYANGGTVMGKVPMTWVSRIYCTSDTPTAFMSSTEGTGGVHGGIFYGGIIETYIKEKTVTFMDGGTCYAVEVVAAGEKAVAPIEPEKDGFEFVCWRGINDSTGDEYDWDFDFNTVDSNVVLTAAWNDTEAPKVTGLEADKTYCSSPVKFKVTDNVGVASVEFGSYTLTSDSDGYYSVTEEMGWGMLVAKDEAGNTTYVQNVTINDGHICNLKENDTQYWYECIHCDYVSTKYDLPDFEIVIDGPDEICCGQDYVFSFKLPDDYYEVSAAGNFEHVGADNTSFDFDGDTVTVTIYASGYEEGESTFDAAAGILFEVDKANNFYYSISAKKKVTIVDGHIDLQHVDAKAATTESEGNIEYWYCANCGKYYSDKELVNEITREQTIIPKLKKNNNGTGELIPKTGDTNPAPWLGVMFISAAVMVALADYERRRKLHSEK